MQNSFADDLAAITRIDVVPTILDVVCRTTGMRFAAVARVTEDRWIACAVRDELAFGLRPGNELDIKTTFCNQIRECRQLVVIDHVAQDDVFRDHPIPQMYGFQSYISVPIRLPDGRFFGTLCALDLRPARLKAPETISMFELYANLIALHLDAQQRLMTSEQALADERQGAELREQFVAVLGHDLRNPVTAIYTGADLLLKMPLDEKAARTVAMIRSSAARITGLIDNVLDFAHARLGGGLSVTRVADESLGAVIEHVVAELRTIHPDRVIRSDLALNHPVRCDSARIGQLLSNLLANALVHGDPAGPIRVGAYSGDGAFELFVANRGESIPRDAIGRLFQPFSRASVQPGRQGLGLGLYIASEIARAHDGTLDVASAAEETRFIFRMPVLGASE